MLSRRSEGALGCGPSFRSFSFAKPQLGVCMHCVYRACVCVWQKKAASESRAGWVTSFGIEFEIANRQGIHKFASESGEFKSVGI